MGSNIRWNPEDLNEKQMELIRKCEERQFGRPKSGNKSKYRVKPKADRTWNGILFASAKEMDYCRGLELLKQAGELKFYLRQVPFHITGGVKYVVDFVEFYPDGSVRFVDVKGVETDMFRLKRKQVQSLYPVRIETV